MDPAREDAVRALSLPSLALLLMAATPAALPDQAAVVGGALAAGEAALASHDAGALMDASETLTRLHAHAEDAGADDLARRWAGQAVQWGARPRSLTVWRGRLTGPGYRQLALAPGGQFQTRQVFAAGHGARVALVALAGARFRLTVAGGDASHLCSREGRGGEVACAWTPLYSEPHRITVENVENQPSRFYLVTD